MAEAEVTDALQGDAYYCGCFQSLGFYVWKPGMEKMPFGFAQRLDRFERWTAKGARQGEAKVTHLAGWTILSFPDVSVDSRPGSHSTFALRGRYDFDAAVAAAREAFPYVFRRFTFEITEAASA